MILCVNNNKGGVLKTTTVTNLAGVLSLKGYRVLIIDADNQSNVALSFGKNPDNFRTTIYDVLVGGVPAEDAIVNVYENIDLLPSNNELVSFEFDVLQDPQTFDEPFVLMKRALSHLKDKYDFILIDTPPSLGVMNGNVFSFADRVIVPYQPETYSMRSLIAVVDTIREFKEIHNPGLEILGVLRTMVIANSSLHKGIVQETRKFAVENNLHVFETVIPRSVQYSNSVGFESKPATLLKKDAKAELYFDLCEEVLELTKEAVR